MAYFRRHQPAIEELEPRAVPALIASQIPLTLPTLTGGAGGEVDVLLQRAAAATASDDAIIAIVDRMGNILGVRVEAGVSATITGDPMLLTYSVDGAVAKARTAAFFASDAAPLTSRTIRFISQSTVTEREVNSYPSDTDPMSPLRGPGFVAPIGLGGHFPPNIPFTPQVDLFAIEHTNRDSIVNPGPDQIKGTADDILLMERFNNDPAFIPSGNELTPPLSYGEAILSAADLANPAVQKTQSRGIATLPGGIPIYEAGVLVGGIGVFFPGDTGFASEENSSMNVNFDPTMPDRTLEAEFIAFSTVADTFPGGGRIDLVGITLDIVGPGGDLGVNNLLAYANANLGVGLGNPMSGTNLPVDSVGTLFQSGVSVPEGWLVLPHDGVGITAAQVQEIIQQGINEANLVRAQIRLPNGDRSRMVFAVADSTGEVLGLYRMPDATVFSIDVAVAKARNTAYYNDPAQLDPVMDQLPGIPAGVSFTNRTFRYLALPRFPEGIDGSGPGPFSILNAPGIDRFTGLNIGAPLPAFIYDGTVVGFDAFHPSTNFQAPTIPQNQNGIVFFPGSSGVYVTSGGITAIVGGFGVSGDGVDQDDVVTVGGISGFVAPSILAADQFRFVGIRLPYFKFPRNPLG